MRIHFPFRRATRLALAAVLTGITAMAHATYPEGPVKLVIGFPPGGGRGPSAVDDSKGSGSGCSITRLELESRRGGGRRTDVRPIRQAMTCTAPFGRITARADDFRRC